MQTATDTPKKVGICSTFTVKMLQVHICPTEGAQITENHMQFFTTKSDKVCEN